MQNIMEGNKIVSFTGFQCNSEFKDVQYKNILMKTIIELEKQPRFHKINRKQSTDDENPSPEQKYYKSHPKKPELNKLKYKTEICKNYSENKYCPYLGKCMFAHGQQELYRVAQADPLPYRVRKCQKFWSEGICKYGQRCRFSHYCASSFQEKNELGLMFLLLKGITETTPLKAQNNHLAANIQPQNNFE